MDEEVQIPSDAPLRVRHLKLSGANRTQPHVFESELQQAYTATTVHGVLQGVHNAAAALHGLGIFDRVDVMLDRAEGGSSNEADVCITVKERGIRVLHAGNRSDTSLEASTTGQLTNPFGNGEVISGSAGASLAGTTSYALRLVRPRVAGRDASLILQARQETHDQLRTSSFTELSRGLVATLRSHDGAHALTGEMTWRDVMPRRHPTVPYAHAASLSVLRESRPSVRSSMRYAYTQDGRDSPYVPTVGPYLQASHREAAVPPGDVSFLKGHIALQQHMSFVDLAPIFLSVNPLPISLGVCLGLGAVRPFGSDAGKPARISDRYFLGGPMMLRGFKVAGTGPRAPKEEGGNLEGDSLGGDIRATASAALSFPFPVSPLAQWGVRLQLFANAGNLTTWQTPLDRMHRDARAAVGVGIVSSLFGMGRVEATWSHVLRKAPHDQTRRAQFGMGLVFE
ncbi:sorting and assembly machinery component 50 [Tribonema minus]|uniref:Sorting and assembly machinery component 50 n=1 Tax=Tribonema minus TaxID=303371 RepID=A0A835YSQ9_9STRA|nr:sorting and assembly machinery component 50 [Tribonema minus]